ncbi:MAG: hypothetical protein IPH84_19715 [Bacteroidales bacterium]|nr:hypothetical protein [Bacteroidales bacterium]
MAWRVLLPVVLTISDTSVARNAISHPVTIHSAPQSLAWPSRPVPESPTQFPT